MQSIEETTNKSMNKFHNWMAVHLLFGLLFLRLPLLAGVALFISPTPNWLSPVYELGTYILTIILIIWERKRLNDFHIDNLAIIIIILLKPIETLIFSKTGGVTKFPLAFPSIPSLLIWIFAFVLILAILLDKRKFPNVQIKTINWLLLGIFVGIIAVIILAIPNTIQLRNNYIAGGLPVFDLYSIFILGFVYQLGYAAISEEPLFRGFLWGYLRKAGWSDFWVWIFQAFLFSIGHIYYFSKLPISFWIIVPISGLILGFMAWKSRSISTSMATHATMNALLYLTTYLFIYLQR